EGAETRAEKYDGPIKYLNIRRFLYRHLKERMSARPGNIPAQPADFNELNKEPKDELCGTALCVVVFMEKGEESVAQSLEVAGKLAERFSKDNFRVVWVDGTKNSAAWRALRASQLAGIEPKVVVWNAKRGKVVEYDGSFEFDRVADFLDKVIG